MKKVPFLILVLICSFFYSQAQRFDSKDVIQKGVKFFDNGQYGSAATEFLKVPMTDTNYALAQYELALSYSRDSTKWEEALVVIKEAQKIPYNQYYLSLLMMEGSVYDFMKNNKGAHKIYDEVIQKHPEYPQVYYEKAIVHYLAKEYAKAISFFEKGLMMNPYHYRSHYYLGKCYYQQGRIAESMIATHFALMATSSAEQGSYTVQQLSFLASGSDSLVIRNKAMETKYKNDAFDEMTEILLSRVALDKKYKLKTDINDAITRQLQVLYEVAAYDADNSSFVAQYYIPFMQNIWKGGEYNELMLYLFSDIGLKFVDKKVKRNKKNVGSVKKDIQKYFAKISGTRKVNYQERNSMQNEFLANGQNMVLCKNKLAIEEKKEVYKFSGPFKYYTKGVLRSEGNYNSQYKKEGHWKYYNMMGVLVEEEQYKNGDLDGWEKIYTAYGVPTIEKFYSDGERITQMKQYDEGDLLLHLKELKKDDPLELTIYNDNGTLRSKYISKEWSPLNGEVKYYHDNKALASTLYYKDAKQEGEAKYYYANGILKSIENYENNKLDGKCTYYYKNGNTEALYVYSDGKLNGPFKKYYLNGKLQMEGEYKNGKFHNEMKNYYYNGKLMRTINYKNGLVIKSKYEDPKNARHNNTPKNKEKFFFSDGTIASELKNNNKGIIDGISRYFYYSGQKKENLNFVNGKKKGSSIYYNRNGSKKAIRNFKDDKFHGAYVFFNLGGDTTKSGYYVTDEIQGTWREYSHGKLSTIETFDEGTLNGPTLMYNEEDGKIYKTNWFDNGVLYGMIEYDQTGKAKYINEYAGGNGQYITHHDNGNEYYKVALKSGSFHGKATKKYFDGKLRATEEYSLGKNIGDHTIYYYNGTKRDYYNYDQNGNVKLYEDYAINGLLDRKYTYSDTDSYYMTEYLLAGNSYRKFDVKEGEITGKEYYYGPKKEIAGIINYHDGKVISYTYLDKSGNYVEPISLHGAKGKVEMYYQNGQKSVEFDFAGGYLQGKYTYYFPDGKVGKVTSYKNQQLYGASKEYTPSGQLIYSANYNDKGYIEGDYSIWDTSGKLIFKATYKDGIVVGVAEMYNKDTAKMMKLTFKNNVIINVE